MRRCGPCGRTIPPCLPPICCCAALVAVLLADSGRRWRPAGAGQAPRSCFCCCPIPSFAAAGGVAVRAQCETFIAAAVTGAFLLLAREPARGRSGRCFGAGLLFGLAFAFKYNAAVYAPRRRCWRCGSGSGSTPASPLAAGRRSDSSCRSPCSLASLGDRGALADLYDATIAYNLQYSGETYAGPLHMAYATC